MIYLCYTTVSFSVVDTLPLHPRDEVEDPMPAPAAPSSSFSRRPRGGATCTPAGGGDSPVSRRRHVPRPRALGSLRGVQQRLDFQAARLSDDED